MKTIIIVCGATATGKSALAESIYDTLDDSRIVNFDSVQVYKDLNIGSAKPTLKEMKKRKHSLYDFVAYPRVYTAGDYYQDVKKLLNNVHEQYLIFVGGSGFYLSAIEKGLLDIPSPSEEVIKYVEERFKKKTLNENYQWLRKKDKLWSDNISEFDEYRIKRAHLILNTINCTITELHQKHQKKKQLLDDYQLVKIGLPSSRESLLPRVTKRTEKMLKLGLIDECRDLLNMGFVDWSPMMSIGYKEVIHYLNSVEGFQSYELLKSEIIKNTLRLAKRQRTWFQKDKEIYWHSNADVLIEYVKTKC